MINFSVLISVYFKDNPDFLEQALNSIINQTLIPSEIIIVQDGEIPNVLNQVIEKFKLNFPVRVLRNIKNEGLGKALNYGLKFCSFDLIARMDADDISSPIRFEKQIEVLLKNPDIDIVGSIVEEFNVIPGDIQRLKLVPEHHFEILRYAKSRNPLNHPSVLFRKSKVLEVGSYEDVLFFEDYHLWCKMLMNGSTFYNIQQPLLYFRVGNDMIGRRHGFTYLKYELFFFKKIYLLRFIGFNKFLKIIALRLPLRLVPKFVLKTLYSNLLRK